MEICTETLKAKTSSFIMEICAVTLKYFPYLEISIWKLDISISLLALSMSCNHFTAFIVIISFNHTRKVGVIEIKQQQKNTLKSSLPSM